VETVDNSATSSDTTENMTNMTSKGFNRKPGITQTTAEITVDSTISTAQQISGLSEEETRFGSLENNMNEFKQNFKATFQQLHSRQQNEDEQLSELLSPPYKNIKHLSGQ
jgi:hypothetical protein